MWELQTLPSPKWEGVDAKKSGSRSQAFGPQQEQKGGSMRPRIPVLISVITLFAALATPAGWAAPERQAEGAPSADAVTANPVPLINQPLVPDAITPGGAAFNLTVNGTGFVSTSVVKWNGSARATTIVSSWQLKA